MVMIKSLILALVGTAAASSVLRRDVSAVLADIQDISTQTDGLATGLKNFNGDPTALLAANQALLTSIGKGTSDANAVPSATETEQASLLTAALGLLPGIYNSLNALEAAKPQFDKLSLTTIVVQQVGSIKTATDGFAAALIAKATGDYATAAKALTAEIDAAFDAAVAFQPLPATSSIAVPTPGGGSTPTPSGSTPVITTTATSSGSMITATTTAATTVTASASTSCPPTSTAGATTPTPTIVTAGAAANSVQFGAVILAVAVMAL